jgi:hypothetical protein
MSKKIRENDYIAQWKKAGFDFNEELHIHRYLCGFKMKKLPTKCYTNKAEWIKDIRGQWDEKSRVTIQKLIDFLELQKVNSEADQVITASFVLPTFIVLMTSFFLASFFDFISFLHTLEKTSGLFVIFIGLMGIGVLVLVLWYIVNRAVTLVYEYKHKRIFIDDYIKILKEIMLASSENSQMWCKEIKNFRRM